VTTFFSRATPNLATVIPAMDHIDNVLTLQSLNRMYEAPIHVALAMGKRTLNRYYTLTDASEVYRIAMSMCTHFYSLTNASQLPTVLHPRHKLSYFIKAGWEPEWIETARKITRTEFDRSYPAKANHESESTMTGVETIKVRTSTIFLPLIY
jgi:hypothetical protein